MPFLLIIHDEICHAMGKKPNMLMVSFALSFFPLIFIKKFIKKCVQKEQEMEEVIMNN